MEKMSTVDNANFPVKRIQLRRPYFPENSREKIFHDFSEVLNSGRLTLGPFLRKFESQFATLQKARYSIGLTSATAGLHLAMVAIGIQPGDEVVIPAKTFVSTANAVVFCGGTPKFCDVQEKTMNMDPDSLQKTITPRTKAVVPVHVAGQPCDMDEIMEICDERSIAVVEDSAHAPHALYKRKYAGTFGRIGVYSFYPDKVVASSDGGMLVTDDEDLAQKIHLLRNCGRKALGDREVHAIGYNYRMNELQAVLGLQQLESLGEMLEIRRKIAKFYDEHLSNVANLDIPFCAPDRTHNYYAYVVRAHQPISQNFRTNLDKLGIETSILFDPVYLFKPYVERFGKMNGLCPVAEKLTDEMISIPLHPALEESDLDQVCKAVRVASSA